MQDTELDLDTNHQRLPLVLTDEKICCIRFIQGDISDYLAVENAFKSRIANHSIQLAALQLHFYEKFILGVTKTLKLFPNAITEGKIKGET